MYNMTFPCPPWAIQKNSVSFLVFSMSYCIYVALAPCSVVLYYMALISVQGPCTSAIVLNIHLLPFSCFCIQHTQSISFGSGVVMTHCIYSIFFLVAHSAMCRNLAHLLFYHPVLYLEHPSPMQTVVYCFLNLAGSSQMPHSLH